MIRWTHSNQYFVFFFSWNSLPLRNIRLPPIAISPIFHYPKLSICELSCDHFRLITLMKLLDSFRCTSQFINSYGRNIIIIIFRFASLNFVLIRISLVLNLNFFIYNHISRTFSLIFFDYCFCCRKFHFKIFCGSKHSIFLLENSLNKFPTNLNKAQIIRFN